MSEQKNNIIILGSRGMLGQDLLSVFPQALGVDREDVDITDRRSMEDLVETNKPDIIINAAAYNNVDACENSEGFALAQKINCTAVGDLADICLQRNITLVHYSTNYIFDGEKTAGYREDDEPQPVNAYGQTKRDGELEILKLQNQGLRYYIIRTSKLFGRPGVSDMAKQSFFTTMLEQAKTKKKLNVVDDELSNFTHTPDLAQTTKSLLTQKYERGVYHIVNENPATWYEGARVLFDIACQDVTLIPVTALEFKREAKRPGFGILLNTKFPKLRNYQEALADYYTDSKFQLLNSKKASNTKL